VVGSLELWSSDDVLCSLMMMIQFSDRRLVVRRKALAATTRYHHPLDSIVIDTSDATGFWISLSGP
jgi:hypothetical protein